MKSCKSTLFLAAQHIQFAKYYFDFDSKFAGNQMKMKAKYCKKNVWNQKSCFYVLFFVKLLKRCAFFFCLVY